MKEGDTISKTKMAKMLTGKTQNMWDKEDKLFKAIALTTRYDGNEATITEIKYAEPYQVIRATSMTQEIKLIYNSKRKEVTQATILPINWRENILYTNRKVYKGGEQGE
jgi:hypothetical protein